VSPSLLKSPKIGGYRGLIETISEAYNLVSASKTIDLSYNYRHDIVKEIGDKAMGKAIGVVSRQVL